MTGKQVFPWKGLPVHTSRPLQPIGLGQGGASCRTALLVFWYEEHSGRQPTR